MNQVTGGKDCKRDLRQELLHGVVVLDSGEAEVEAEVAEGETFVIDAEELENGGLEVVDVDGVFGDVEAEVVGLT